MILLLKLGADGDLISAGLKNLLNNCSILFLHLSNVRGTDRTGTEAERLFVKDLLLIICSLSIANGGADDGRVILRLSVLLGTLSPPFNCTPPPSPEDAFDLPDSPIFTHARIISSSRLMSTEKAGQIKIYAVFTLQGNRKLSLWECSAEV
jgi:hypothetical protein